MSVCALSAPAGLLVVVFGGHRTPFCWLGGSVWPWRGRSSWRDVEVWLFVLSALMVPPTVLLFPPY